MKEQDSEFFKKLPSERRMLTGMFSDPQSIENAYNLIHERGYTYDDVNFVMSDKTREAHFNKDKSDLSSKALEGAGTGAAIGGAVGAAAGVIAALAASVAIPGLGLVIAGPIISGLAGAGGGGVTGGLIGAFVGSGIPEERAKIYDSGIQDGKILMGVNIKNDEDAEFFRQSWESNKAENIHY